MSLLSRLLKRDDRDGEGPTAGTTDEGSAPRPGPTPTAPPATPGAVTAATTAPPPLPPPPRPPIPTGSRVEAPLITAAAVDEAFRNLVDPQGRGAARPPRPAQEAAERAADQAAVRATFEELAVDHMAPLRNLMLEVRWGEAQVRWIELARPALRSLRAMAAQIELTDLVSALDEFGAGLDRAAENGGSAVTGEAREALLAAYLPLARKLTRAFAIDGERDRREPLIVESLLRQVPGLDPLLLLKLSAVGLSRLESLLRASADEIACVAGMPQEVAAAVVDKMNEFQRDTPAGLASDGQAACAPLEALVTDLEVQHLDFERVENAWSPEEVAARRHARRERERAYLAVKAALARLGEVDLVLALEKLPFTRRIERLGDFLREAGAGRTASPPATHNQPVARVSAGGRDNDNDMDMEGAGHGRAHA